jgi:hypothetical protein
MRGGSQAFDVECDDGRRYVAKFKGNPQGTKILVNELMVAAIMEKLEICTPNLRILSLSAVTQQKDDLYCSMGAEKIPYVDGYHLGSQFPVNPDETAIVEFLPAPFLPKVVNLGDFAATWVLDRWLNNIDPRQSIFVRAKNISAGGFRALMIDHGHCLGGSHWKIVDSPPFVPDHDRSIYSLLSMRSECEGALSKIGRLGSEMLLDLARRIPAEWLEADDREQLERLIDQILVRQGRLSAIIEPHLDCLMARRVTQGENSRIIFFQH